MSIKLKCSSYYPVMPWCVTMRLSELIGFLRGVMRMLMTVNCWSGQRSLGGVLCLAGRIESLEIFEVKDDRGDVSLRKSIDLTVASPYRGHLHLVPQTSLRLFGFSFLFPSASPAIGSSIKPVFTSDLDTEKFTVLPRLTTLRDARRLPTKAGPQ